MINISTKNISTRPFTIEQIEKEGSEAQVSTEMPPPPLLPIVTAPSPDPSPVLQQTNKLPDSIEQVVTSIDTMRRPSTDAISPLVAKSPSAVSISKISPRFSVPPEAFSGHSASFDSDGGSTASRGTNTTTSRIRFSIRKESIAEPTSDDISALTRVSSLLQVNIKACFLIRNRNLTRINHQGVHVEHRRREDHVLLL